ncbi:LPD38 domain-containing protein [Comamonas sp.]|uniref:LPD38 domain-containing protein n=1 Tax=Comamonas sp. TaxID=34028 RepID=UPI00289A9A25|nr:LPD38 domain-containing protein [Comamonas sp.]
MPQDLLAQFDDDKKTGGEVDLFELAGIDYQPPKPKPKEQGLFSTLTEVLSDGGKRASGAGVAGVASIPVALQSSARAGVRSGASGEPSTVMPAGVFIPGIDTDEAINGPMDDADKAKRELAAERLALKVKVPYAEAIAKAGKDTQEDINKTTSQATQDAVANSQITGNLLKGEIDFGKDPSARGVLMQGFDVVGSMLPMMATAVLTRSPGAAGAVGGAMAAGEGVGNARDFIAKQTHEQLLEHSPIYKRMVDAGASPEDARAITSARAEDTAALLQGAVASVGDRFTGKLVTGGFDKLLTRAAGKSVMGRAAAGAAVSGLEEGTQELSEGIASDLGIKSVAGNKEVGEDSAANFVLGALGGSAPGAGRGVVSGVKDRLADRAAGKQTGDAATSSTAPAAPPAPAAPASSSTDAVSPAPAQPQADRQAASGAAGQTQQAPAGVPEEVARAQNLDGAPETMSPELAEIRLAELELEASTTGLNPVQDAERQALAERVAVDRAQELDAEAIGVPVDQVSAPGAEQGAARAAAENEAAPAPAAGVESAAKESTARTWPQFVLEQGERVSELKKGTPRWNELKASWDALKISRAGQDAEGTGAAGEPKTEIQNRDRSRPASIIQMQGMAANPDYMRLGVSRSPESGAPMVFAVGDQAQAAVATGRGDTAVMSDGQRVPFQYAVMEAADVQPSNFADGAVNPLFDSAHPGTVKALNNGRTAGLRAAYERGTAEGYKRELMADSDMHGIDPAVIEGMKAPMLVRVYSEGDNRTNMGAKSQSQALGLSASEQAATDAALMDNSVVDAFATGALDSAANRDFARAFIGKLQAAGQDVAGMMDANGALSPAGVTRLQAGLVHKAYGDGDLVESLFGSTDNDIRAIGEALKDVAGEWANLRSSVEAGAINPEVDVTANLLQAIRVVQKARRERGSLHDAINQVDMVTGDVLDPLTVGMLRLLYTGHYLTRATGRERLTESLREYMAAALATSVGGDMFGEQVGPAEILNALSAAPAQPQNEPTPTRQDQSPTPQGERVATGSHPAGSRADEAGQPAPGQEPSGAGPSVAEAGRRSEGQDAQDSSGQQDRQGAEGAGQDGSGTVTPELELSSYSPEELQARQEAQEQAAKANAKVEAEERGRAEADAERENFWLTGSDRAADTLAAQGQAPMFSRSASTQQAYEARIDALFSGHAQKDSRTGVRVLDRSDMLAFLGMGDGPVSLAESKVNAAKHPNMTAEVWKKIPLWLDNPAAVFDSATVQGRLVMIAPELVDGAPVLMVVEPQKGGMQVHLLQNAYDKDDSPPPVGRWLREGLAHYVNQKEFPAILQQSGLQLSSSAWQNKPGTRKILSEKNFSGYLKANPSAATESPLVAQGKGPKLSRGESGKQESTAPLDRAGLQLPKKEPQRVPRTDEILSENNQGDRGLGVAADADTDRDSARVRRVVDGFVKGWANAPEVIVTSDMQDAKVPKAVRDYDAAMRSDGAEGVPEGFYYKGKVYLVASQLHTPMDVVRVLFHETLGHHGLKHVFGAQLDPILQQLASQRAAQVKKKAAEYGLDMADHAQRSMAAEEVLAEMAQTHPELGYVKRAIAAVRQWLRKNVPALAKMQLTDADIIHSFILPARDFVVRGKAEASGQVKAGAAPAFSRAPAPAGAPQGGNSKLAQLQAKARSLLDPSKVDTWLYHWQDKFIDLKRIQEQIKALNGTVSETNDAYRGEELYHKRVAKRAANFLRDEVRPLMKAMNDAGVGIEEFERYLHARHAAEANKAMAERNPSQQELVAKRATADQTVTDLRNQLQRAQAQGLATVSIQKALGQALIEKADWDGAQAFNGTEDQRLSLSGMSDQEAAKILASYTGDAKKAIEDLGARVDQMNEGTLRTLDDYGLMDKATLNTWRNAYQHYVPLHRDEANPDSKAHPIGQGFSTKGDAAKKRTGSNEKVTNILSHIVMQREAALTRGEKNNVAKRLYLLAAQNPDPSLWSLDLPKKKILDPDTGLVRTEVDRSAVANKTGTAIAIRIGGKDKYLVFNERNERAARLALAVKNMDAAELDWLSRTMGHITRWLAAVNTQYNPVFSVFNIVRDLQGASLQLSDTKLAGKQKDVLANIAKNTGKIWAELRRERKEEGVGTGPWAQLMEQFQLDGGTTGFRELYSDPNDRLEALQKELRKGTQGAAAKGASFALGVLSDFNESLEMTTRLATYKVALDNGLSRQEAASLAKNITVNFNRKGRVTSVLGSHYAFLNAAIQGNARLLQTMTGPAGRKIALGGVGLGVMMALMGQLMMGGGDGADDEWKKIPEFVKERNIIIPLSRTQYVTIPMPLGFHVLPNLGRKMVDAAFHNDPTVSRAKYVGDMAAIVLNAYNPFGGSDNMMQMFTPTWADPAIALATNKDWMGKSIFKEVRDINHPTPGHARVKDATALPYRWAARGINAATGGSEWEQGAISPTPEAIQYLVEQAFGGVLREANKLGATATAAATGEELAPHQWFLVGRVYGNTTGMNGQSGTYYDNTKRINVALAEAKARIERGENVDAVLKDVPLAKAAGVEKLADKRVSDLTKLRRKVQASDLPDKKDQVKAINKEIESTMRLLNLAVAEVVKQPS